MGTAPDMSEYLGVFLEEAEDQVETLDEGLLRLEKEPGNQELLQGIFRAAHSLKSSSAAMGFAAMSRLCHASESVLDKLRSGEMAAGTAVIDLLLSAADALKTMKEAIRAGATDALDVEHVVAALAAASGASTAAPKSAGDEQRGDDADERFLDEATLHVVVELAADCAMPAVRAQLVLNALEKVGQILRTDPPPHEVTAGGPAGRLRVVMAGEVSEEIVRGALGAVSEIARVEVTADQRAFDFGRGGRGRSPAELAAASRRADQTVRVNVARLDNLMNLTGELVIDRERLAQLGGQLEARYGGVELVRDLREMCRHMSRIVGDLQEEVTRARLLPIAQAFRRFPRMVRDLAHRVGKEVDFVLEGEETELDRSVIEEIVDPLNHLVRNAVDHGLEYPHERGRLGKRPTGKIILAARQEENHIIIEVTDDGSGIDVAAVRESAVTRGVVTAEEAAALSDEEALQLVFAPGLSTARQISDVSGRGVGMDVVKSNVKRLHGTVQILTKLGIGTTVVVRLPLTLAISEALLVKSGEETYAIPLVYVVETTRIPQARLRSVRGRLATVLRGRMLPLVHLGHALAGRAGCLTADRDLVCLVVARSEDREAGLIVDGMLGAQEIVLKSLGSALRDVVGLSGTTILGNGTVALVVDVGSLLGDAGLEAARRAQANLGS